MTDQNLQHVDAIWKKLMLLPNNLFSISGLAIAVFIVSTIQLYEIYTDPFVLVAGSVLPL